MESEIAKIYGNHVRIRACGLCYEGNKLLMVNHGGITSKDFWAPPGGGVSFGMSIEETLRKEFIEETNLTITVGKFAFGCEFIQSPLHAVELFFEVKQVSGMMQAGYDPELQIIRDAAFFSPDEIRSLPQEMRHGIFKYYSPASGLGDLKGFYHV